MKTRSDIQKPQRSQIKVDLALQGGGAHGAFTWGVLDRLLEESWIQWEGVSGTSAGAMNAAVMVQGYAQGGALGAKELLEKFWRNVSHAAVMSPFQRSPLDILAGEWTLDYSPAFMAFNMFSGVASPYQFNMLGFNPLKLILDELIDFKALSSAPIKLFITATNVRTGQGRVFHNEEMTADVLLASACLPSLYQAVIIDGDPYWDGGYAGNPSIAPLVLESAAQDTILVQINPIERHGVPTTPGCIMNRLNEISFNATLLKELKMIALLRRVVNPQDTEGERWANMRMHLITSASMSQLGYSSKLNAEWGFLVKLKEDGRQAADRFLMKYAQDVGKRSSLNLDELLQIIPKERAVKAPSSNT